MQHRQVKNKKTCYDDRIMYTASALDFKCFYQQNRILKKKGRKNNHNRLGYY